MNWKLTFLLSNSPGLFATRVIDEGDIVCDYHGTFLSKKEGHDRFQQITADNYYFFQFKHGWFDAQSDSCECHPGMKTKGRKINHSKAGPNLKPIACKMQLEADKEKAHVILFRATKRVDAGEQFFYDYNVNERTGGGESQGMDWLKS